MAERVLLLKDISPAAGEAFTEAGFAVDTFPKDIAMRSLGRAVKQTGTRVVGVRSGPRLTDGIIGSPTLEAIGVFATGLDAVDTTKALRKGVAVLAVKDESALAVAEYVTGTIYGISRGLFQNTHEMKRGNWIKSHEGSRQVEGKTLGIVGFGRIGRQTARKALANRMNVLAYDVNPDVEIKGRVRGVDLEELLAKSDYVTLHASSNKGDPPILDEAALFAMKEGSYLINAGRASLVDYEALYKVLKKGYLGGAVIDVWGTDEPKSSRAKFRHRLARLPIVAATSHIAASSVETQDGIGRGVAGQVIDFLQTANSEEVVNFSENMKKDPGPMDPDFLRLVWIHKNMAGAVAAATRLVSRLGGNLVAAELGSPHKVEIFHEIGYLTLDFEDLAPYRVPGLQRKLSETPFDIKSRVIFG
ncbi:hypothetical protein A3F65_03695 [Candidatus Saccharibacteria bacterium RIFCSPHIGHO2_12_FULL_47_16b]|nr:MAG: hypothetical protein A3F65_03695 [Candidatus Saccharibacteria bacterium RIFCSPHIGHO2_12_FULL_47_16b]